MVSSARIQKLKENGLIDKWSRDILPKENKCKIENANDQPLKRLSLGHLSGAFTILLIGYVWAIGVFIGEKILFKCRTQNDREIKAEIAEPVAEPLKASVDVTTQVQIIGEVNIVQVLGK